VCATRITTTVSVGMYAELAISFPLAKGADLVDALTVLNPIAKNIRLQLGVGAAKPYGRGAAPRYLKGEERADAISALRKIHGVFDRLLFSNLIAEEQKAPFKSERARLSAFIQRVMFKDGDHSRVRNDARGQGHEQELVEEAETHGYLRNEEGEEEVRGERREDGDATPAWRKQWARQVERPAKPKMMNDFEWKKRDRYKSPMLDAKGATRDM
jgi:hypothetical protein